MAVIRYCGRIILIFTRILLLLVFHLRTNINSLGAPEYSVRGNYTSGPFHSIQQHMLFGNTSDCVNIRECEYNVMLFAFYTLIPNYRKNNNNLFRCYRAASLQYPKLCTKCIVIQAIRSAIKMPLLCFPIPKPSLHPHPIHRSQNSTVIYLMHTSICIA